MDWITRCFIALKFALHLCCLCCSVAKVKRTCDKCIAWVRVDMVVLPGYRYLEVVPGRRGGRPTVKGTRVTVDDILEMLAVGWKPEEVAEELDIPLEAVYEALRFASETVKRVTVVA